MDKFSKKIKNKNNRGEILFDNEYVQVIQYEDWSIVKERDLIVCIPYLIETNQIILRYEYIPTFKYNDNQEYHITVISGTIEENENPETTVLRELEEEAGLVLRPDYKIEFMKPLYISKGCVNKYYPLILTLNENDYHEVIAKGDGSKAENLSKPVKVNVKYINSINASDLITEYMLMKLKEYLGLNKI